MRAKMYSGIKKHVYTRRRLRIYVKAKMYRRAGVHEISANTTVFAAKRCVFKEKAFNMRSFPNDGDLAGGRKFDDGRGFVAMGVALAGQTDVINGCDDSGVNVGKGLRRRLAADVG